MAKSSFRFLTVLLLASILIFSSVIPTCRAEEVENTEEEPSFDEDNIASEVVQTAEEEQQEPIVEEETFLRSSPGIEVACVFPKHDSKMPVIPAGDPTDIVVGILNGGESDVKVVSLDVKLVFPLDYRSVIQNFTVQKFESIISPGEQASFPISFTPSKHFQPRDFGLTGIILYKINGEDFGSAFYNGTVEIIEPIGYVSGESIFLVLLGLACFGLLLMWSSSQFKSFAKKTKKSKKTESSVNEGEGESKEDEWLQGTNYYSHQKRSIKLKSKPKSSE